VGLINEFNFYIISLPVSVNAKFEPLRMDIVSNILHSIGERHGIREDHSIGIATNVPAIVNVDVFISELRRGSGRGGNETRIVKGWI
jgi:hypothetical protein